MAPFSAEAEEATEIAAGQGVAEPYKLHVQATTTDLHHKRGAQPSLWSHHSSSRPAEVAAQAG